jgi:D-alanine-D-alanine ligase
MLTSTIPETIGNATDPTESNRVAALCLEQRPDRVQPSGPHGVETDCAKQGMTEMNDKNFVVQIDRHIEVVTTDTSGMKETGFGSVETCRRVCDVLKSRYRQVHFNQIKSERDLEGIVARKPDLVVLCVKYIVDEERNAKIWLSDYLSRYGIQHTGSGRAALEFDSDKSKAKIVLLENGLATAKFFLAQPGLFVAEGHLPVPLPLFVKPLDAANGNGVDENSLVHDFASYEAKVEEIFATYGVAALVEEVLPGREFTVAVFDDHEQSRRLILPVEIVAPENAKGDRVLGHKAKSSNMEKLSKVEDSALPAISVLASKVFSVLGARDFGRIDVKMDAHGIPHFIETNLVPGMTPGTSYFPRACGIDGAMSYESVALKIVELALSRSELSRNLDRKSGASRTDPGHEMRKVGDGSDQQPCAVILQEEDLPDFGPKQGVPALSDRDGGQPDGESAS